jgi:hypothetical protein
MMDRTADRFKRRFDLNADFADFADDADYFKCGIRNAEFGILFVTARQRRAQR